MSADVSPEVSRVANAIGFALAERGVELSADDAAAAARRALDQRAARVAVIGRTLADARHWAREYLGEYPELASAMFLQSGRKSPAARGAMLRRVFVTPGALRGRRFAEISDDCRRGLAKTPGADAYPVYFPERRA